jgi:ribosomal protein S18 acetylase RimI-like enzyme
VGACHGLDARAAPPAGILETVTYQTVAENLRESFRVIAASRAAGEVRELQGVSIASAAVTFQMFNASFLSAAVSSEVDLTQRILLASLHFETRGQEWACWVCEDWMDPRTRRRSRALFQKYGLKHSVSLPGMVAGRILPPVKGLPGLDVRRVCDPSTRDAFCAIGSACFHVPYSWFREVFNSDTVWDRFAAYVGYTGGVPVSTAAIVMGSGAAGVYNVATMPGYQRQGYGEAVMRYALEDARARHGVEQTILQSTPAGLRLYERMGYRTITTVAVYST